MKEAYINEFYTLKGYELAEDAGFTHAMEDYLEMICRVRLKGESIRVRDIAEKLNVKPSSASKMIRNLSGLGYLQAEKYGDIMLTEKGKAAGIYLLYRHGVIHDFLCYVNGSDNELEEAEKIEHFLKKETVRNIEILLRRLRNEGKANFGK